MDPYFGITDFDSRNAVDAMNAVLMAHRPTPHHKLHVGMMMSRKTLYGEPTLWAKAWTAKENIADVLSNPDTYTCIHYADYASYEDRDQDLRASLVRAMSYGGPHLSALQLDMTWPDAEEVRWARDMFLGETDVAPEIILQIGTTALKQVGNNPKELVRELWHYRYVVNRVLIDKSCGKGKPLDPKEHLSYLRAIRDCFPDMGLVDAGGLSATTMHLMEPIWEELPDVSTDAQGGTRPSRSAKDPVDWNMAKDYLIAACATRAKYNKS